ncbi:hypothetical protein [Nocardioides halotolerans]|jgi:hypothetical protein|uniref:hypothetical protein n=1 Tax=Nocardioides halotolerans TaxID=433660 RepID=UPI000490CDDA|nr:hypothetical protein [Nocardioides halotolerans]
MPGLRHVVLAPVVCVLLLAGALPGAAQPAERRALPETVVINDNRSSAPIVDISKVVIDASWYWDSEQSMSVTVPHGFQAGHRLTVWFDVNGDSRPDGHYRLDLRAPKHAGGKSLQKSQEFRRGGGWTQGGSKARCGGSEGGPPLINPVRRGQRTLGIVFDLWWCLGVPNPAGADSGAWRVAVSVAKGRNEDMAPNHHGWSKPVAGWGPCDPSGGAC